MTASDIETNTGSINLFYRLINDFATLTPPWGEAIRYQTLPDERWDMSLVSARVYGRRDEFLTVQAAAGLDSIEYELVEQLLVLPTDTQLTALKAQAKFVNLDVDRPSSSPSDVPADYAAILKALVQ
jgi:hypothetical protein